MHSAVPTFSPSLRAAAAGFALLLCCGTPSVFAQARPATTQTPSDPLGRGISALANGDLEAARLAFAELIKSNPRDPRGHHGMALVYLARGDVSRACASIDQALLLTPLPDRALVLNGAVCHWRARNQARAARVVKDYFTAHPREIDEPLLNALGAALMAATPQERANRLFIDATSLYEQLNKRLEAQRPGYKRYGAEWQTAAEVDARAEVFKKAQRELDPLQLAIEAADQKIESIRKEIDRQQMLVRHYDPAAPAALAAAQQALPTAITAARDARQKYDDQIASLDRPRFPEIKPVGMDQLVPPPLAPVKTTQPTTLPATQPAVAVRPLTSPSTRPAYRIVQFLTAFAVSDRTLVTSGRDLADGDVLRAHLSDGQLALVKLVRRDDKLGLALLSIPDRRLPCLDLGAGFEPGALVCVGFATGELVRPRLHATIGSAPAQPADGSAWTIALPNHPGLAGAPLFANSRLIGICMAGPDAPLDRLPALTLAQLKTFVAADAPATQPLRPGQDVAGAILQIEVLRPMTP